MRKSKLSKERTLQSDLILELAQLITGKVELQAIPETNWSGIVRLARRHGLAPMLWWNLRQQGRQVSDCVAFKDPENSAKIAGFNYQLMRENQSKVQLALTQAGIPAIWIKGIALAQTLYPQPQLRPMDDLDVLVPYDQSQAALKVIQSIGYYFPRQDALAEKMRAAESTAHHYHLRSSSASEIILEIHFRLLGDEILLPIKEMDWFWQEREIIGQGQAAFSVLKPEANFLYLCAHTILAHGEFEFRLQRYYDLHLLVSQTRLDWDLILSRAMELGWTYTVKRALVLTYDYFATPVPQWVMDKLNNYRQSDKDYLHARQLRGNGLRWEGTLSSLAEFSWAERMRQLFHLTFPPAEYMRVRYDIPAGRALLSYYIFRWLDAAGVLITASLQRLGFRK